jgi:cytochrome c(L)
MIRKSSIAVILAALLLGTALMQGEGSEHEEPKHEEPKPPLELKTDGWAWTKSHSQIQNPATILGGPLQVEADQEGMVFWIFPGPRKLDPHVFGTPEKPLAYAPPFPLYGVPVDKRAVSEDGTRFTQTKEPTAFSDNWTSMHGGKVRMTVVDVTATDAAKTQDKVDFEMSFPSPEGDHSYTVRVNKVLPHGVSYPFLGGVATNTLLHGFSGVGTPMMPTEFTYVAFWGIGTVERDGQVVNENQLVHMMVTEPVRGENYRLSMDPQVPGEAEDPSAKMLHLLVPPFRVEPGAQEPLKKQPVKTGVMVQGPQGELEQPLFHVMIHDIELTATRLAQAAEPANARKQSSSHGSGHEDEAANDGGEDEQQSEAGSGHQNQEGEAAGGGQATGPGETVYSNSCAPCHGPQGKGGIGPALAGNENLQDADLVVQQILHGGGGMPAFGEQLTAEQVAAVASHERTSWGNEFGEVSPAMVRQISTRPEREGEPLQARAGPEEGWYTSEQASAGAAWYQEHCARCHGANLAGVARNPALVGDHFLADFEDAWKLFDFVSTRMPFDKPGELNQRTYLEIVAHILQQNGFATGPDPLPMKKEQLQKLKITTEMAGITLIPDPDDPADVDEPEKLNLFTGNQEAIADGKTLFTGNKCAACHGAEGGGAIGPDLSDAYWIYGAHDGAVFDVITTGRDGMPPFENLADEEVWKIIAFIRSLYRGPEQAVNW